VRTWSEARRAERVRDADAYLAKRSGCYEHRCHRYDSAIEAMYGLGLDDRSTVVDVGSGWGELGHRMATGSGKRFQVGMGTVRDEFRASRARYIPVDACVDGTDLETWVPPRGADFFVCLEVIEHLQAPYRLMAHMRLAATKGVIVSTPNPERVDVLAMCPDHVTPIPREGLEAVGFHVEQASFYGGDRDALFAVWSPVFV
jgi:hypothetical protein